MRRCAPKRIDPFLGPFSKQRAFTLMIHRHRRHQGGRRGGRVMQQLFISNADSRAAHSTACLLLLIVLYRGDKDKKWT
eukprot:COSAG03_NODE_2029_length_3204_cov_11.004831_3_plen_78_part_00